MFDIAFNIDLLKYNIEHFSLQKAADTFNLKKVTDFQEFFMTLHTKGLLPRDEENMILNGEYELTQKKNGFDLLECSYYDRIEWNNQGIYYVPEHGNKKEIVSNVEIIGLKEYILS